MDLYLIVCILIVSLFSASGIWLPAEVIEIDGQDRVLGYLLKDDGQWATILIDEPREILVVPSATVQSRRVCTKEDDDPSPSLASIIASDQAAQPICENLLEGK